MFTIRNYGDADRSALLALARTQLVDPANDETAIDRYLAHLLEEVGNGAKIVLAEDSGVLGGFVAMSAPLAAEADGSPAATYVMISDIYVTPNRRRNGIATALTHRAEEIAREAGASRVTLKALSRNIDAIAFYRRQAYREQFVVMDKVLTA